MLAASALFTVLIAGTPAQTPQADEAPDVIVDFRTRTDLELTRRLLASGGFTNRAHPYNRAIYDTGVPVTGAPSTGDFRGPGNGFVMYDDITTLPVDGPITIRAIKFSIWVSAQTADHLFLKLEFFPAHAGTAAPADANPWLGEPIVSALANLGTGWTFGGSAYLPVFIGLDDMGLPQGITLPSGGTYGVRLSIWGLVDGELTPQTDNQMFSRGLLTCWPVGTSDFRRWYGIPSDDAKMDRVVNDPSHYSGQATSNRAMFFGLAVATDPPAPGPPPSTDLGVLPDAGLTVQGALGAGEVKWYRFSLASDATDNAMQFLDIDSEQSKGDVGLMLVGRTGTPIVVDRDSGSGVQAQLTFGMGRRAAVGDGLQYDGRHRDARTVDRGLRAHDGPFYLCVTSDPATFAQNHAFDTIRSCGPGGAYTINLRTNTNGTPLAASIPPIVAADDDLGGVVGTRMIPNATRLSDAVRWIRFSTCADIAAQDSLTIASALQPGSVFGAGHALFDGSGNLVASSRDGSPLSPPPLHFGGTHPMLHAGMYYLAQFRDPGSTSTVQFAPNPATQGRWHVRSGGTGVTSSGTITASWSDCTICHDDRCVADVDDGSATGTPDGGVTLDDLLFYLTRFAGGAACADIDNGSGTGTPDGGVTLDDLLYYFARFAAGC